MKKSSYSTKIMIRLFYKIGEVNMDNKKKIILSVLVVLLILAIGVAYAFFSYESGTKSDIVTGQIYMNYEETSTISLTGVFPETKAQALARQDENGVFEFTITGRNTSKYPVYYEIDLLDGGVVTGKTEQSTKILPEHVMIYLERDGEPLVDGMTFKDFNNRRIYVDTVPANQATNIEHKYTLRMWIDENVTISDTDTSADYTTKEWNDAYASLKVRVVGDFEYKEASTDTSCFAYNVVTEDFNYDITYDYPIITLDTSEEKVNACMANMMDDYGEDLSTAQDGYQSYCEGTGTFDDGSLYTLKRHITEWLNNGGIEETENILSFYPVVTNITMEGTGYYELNTSEESMNACMEYMTTYFGGEDLSTAQDGYQSFCEGTGTLYGEDSIFSDFVVSNFGYSLIERDVFTQVEETPQKVIEITNYDETCGTDVVIPSTIEGLPVTRIADANRDTSPFGNRGITSVKFPNTLRYIGVLAFDSNNLTEITIPDSVTEIGESAFDNNDLNNIEIGTGITSIGDYAFDDNPLVTVNIKSNPSLGEYSFASSIQNTFSTFQYGGTCTELNQYTYVLQSAGYEPQTIITTDTNSCVYNNYYEPK